MIRRFKTEELVEELTNRGAIFTTRKDSFGETRKGWFIDDVYLGLTIRQAMDALALARMHEAWRNILSPEKKSKMKHRSAKDKS